MSSSIDFLAWDSEFFKKQVGRLTVKATARLDELIEKARRQSYELLYIYSPVPIARHTVDGYTLLDVGGHISFSKSLAGEALEEVKPEIEICEFELDTITPDLLEAALLSGQLSRFKIDPFLPTGSFQRLYGTWLANALKNRPKSAVYTYHNSGNVGGMITIETRGHRSTIGLLAVLQPYQGKGVATKLIKHIEQVCIKAKITSVEVKTQLSNTSARALYLKNAFTEHERSFLYHAHNVQSA